MAWRLGELAARIGADLSGDPEQMIDGVASLANAGPTQLTFLSTERDAAQLQVCRAAAVIVADGMASDAPMARLSVADPYAAFARISELFDPGWHRDRCGIDPRAVVDPRAEVAEDAWVGPCAVVEADARIAAGARVGPGCVVGEGVELGEASVLVANVTLCRGVRVGRHCLIHPGAVIGADGFGFAPDGGRWRKIAQLGTVVIGDEVEVGASTTIDRGTLDDTVIGDGVKIDDQVHIAHNVRIGEDSILAGCVGISGSAEIGRRCRLGGSVGLVGHISLCDDVTVTGMSMVTKSIRTPGVWSSGWAAVDDRDWKRSVVRFRRLGELERRVKELEQLLAAQTTGK